MSDESGDVIQDVLNQAIQESVNLDGDIDGSLVIGWVVIAELATPDGNRNLTVNEKLGLATWQVQGMLLDVLVRTASVSLRGWTDPGDG